MLTAGAISYLRCLPVLRFNYLSNTLIEYLWKSYARPCGNSLAQRDFTSLNLVREESGLCRHSDWCPGGLTFEPLGSQESRRGDRSREVLDAEGLLLGGELVEISDPSSVGGRENGLVGRHPDAVEVLSREVLVLERLL